MHVGEHATNSNMVGCIVLVQMHVMFVCIRFLAARASVSPFVGPSVIAEHDVYDYVHEHSI